MAARIGYNALALRPGGTGVQTYVRELLGALVPILDASLVAAVQADAADELPAAIERQLAPVVAGTRRAIAGLRSPGQFDLIHGLNVDLPLQRGTPMVTTVHDMSVFDVPWTMPRHVATGKRLVYRRALRRADAVIAVSTFTAERVHDRLGYDAIVVPLGAPSDLAPANAEAVANLRTRYDLPPVFILHVGTIEPRKNLAMVADVCDKARVPLVLAGPQQPGHAPPPGARLLGYVPRSELAALYGAATAVVAPSLYEGFGLSVIEAMSCGAPVIATRVGALIEVVGGAGVLLGPDDRDGWARALSTVVEDGEQRAAMSHEGCQRAARYTWAATAAGTAEVYARLGVDART